ncbi:hypothetical protein B0H10DRAFT_1952741 [Mycena sp. CBHHK59/15]|nr:hypothetical protein B0H10DRAFT_1952741 [Mycena sp. CBHHK59/15]
MHWVSKPVVAYYGSDPKLTKGACLFFGSESSLLCGSHRFSGYKIGVAFDFEHHVLAFFTLDLLIQFYWSEKREDLPAQQPDVYLEFPPFLEDLVSTEIFPGEGVYTVAELWHMAGLSPNLTEAEVFDSPSRTAWLSCAFFHFGKEAHTTLWSLVKRFLVGYVICVHEEHHLLYSDRLHVYGKDCAYVTTHFNNLLSDFKNPEVDLVSLVFRADLWAQLHSQAGLLESCLSSDNVLARFYSTTPIPPEMSVTWLTWLNLNAYTFLFNGGGKASLRASHPRTLLYRASATDIWSVIPTYPSNSAPIPRAKPPKLPAASHPPAGKYRATSMAKKGKNPGKCHAPPAPKPKAPPRPSPTPMHECDMGTQEKALLSYIIQHTLDYTVGPLDYCGIARLIKGRGADIIMYCKGDLCIPEFYQRRQALAEVLGTLLKPIPKI